MAAHCSLICQYMNQQLDLILNDHLVHISTADLSKCSFIYEDGQYEIYFSCDEYPKDASAMVEVCINGDRVGVIAQKDKSDNIEGYVEYDTKTNHRQPFLLHYDLVVLSFIVIFPDGHKKGYCSDFLLSVSKNKADVENISKMINELNEFDDSKIGDWIFSNSKQDTKHSLHEGGWNRRTYKSLISYIQLLGQIASCYQNNYAYFKLNGKHTLRQTSKLVSSEAVKTMSRESINWIFQNTDQLSAVPYKTGIHYHGKNYLPSYFNADYSEKSWDVYENRIVVGFLYTVLLHSTQIYSELKKDVLNEEQIAKRIHGIVPMDYDAPIITVKSVLVKYNRDILSKLKQQIEILRNLSKRYDLLFSVPIVQISTLPRKTNVFREIKPYMQVFETISRWYKDGEYNLEKNRLILRVKTLDKLFEYYCLLRLLKLFVENGFREADITSPVTKHSYKLADSLYQNENDVPNTYALYKGNIRVTIYYQPVISAFDFENGLTLFRTTTRNQYYTPDFVLKFSVNGHNEEYVILDSKFSSRQNIKQYHLPEVIRKYSCEIGSTGNVCAPKMVWILQGRVNGNEAAIWRYHNSPLAYRCRPVTSYGIASINTFTDIRQQLWHEIKNSISFL